MQNSRPATAVTVVAPARLHLGFLDLNGGLGRRFGSIGLAVEEPATILTATAAETFTATGPEAGRALAHARSFAEAFGLTGGARIDIARAIPAHAGLGSGTQLALATGTAMASLAGRDVAPAEMGEMVARGARSAIGIASFAQGGFVIDAGKGASSSPPPVIAHVGFPEHWRVLLIVDPAHQGVHGERESRAFATLAPMPDATAAHVCRLVLMRLLPGLMEEDLATFGDGLTEVQEIVGGHFAAAQGGSMWSSPAVGRLARALGEAGARGIGQSSWGPTGFAFTDSEAAAARLLSTFVGEAKREGLAIMIVKGRNAGARTTSRS